MTTLNARANQAYGEYVERQDSDGYVWLGFDNEQNAFEEGWATGYKTAAEELAETLVTAADELDMPPTTEWLALRDWFKDLLHETAAVVREEVSS